MRLRNLVLVVLLGVIQYPLWLGKGGWLKVWELEDKVQSQNALNHLAQQRNASLEAEVRDLKEGTRAIEERARVELSMIRDDEIFVHVANVAAAAPVQPTSGEATSAARPEPTSAMPLAPSSTPLASAKPMNKPAH